MNLRRLFTSLLLAAILASAPACQESPSSLAPAASSEPVTLSRLAEALAFHAPFDGAPDAAFAKGDPKVYTGKELGKDGEAGLTTPEVAIAKGKGRFGDALQFRKKVADVVFFRGGPNMPYAKADWSGSVSFWLSLDPEEDLAPGYADPIQITERGWNDGALFVDFTKDDVPRHFRLGAFADRKVWDPNERNWDDVPVAERPMADVARTPFGRGKWTHVAFTWSRFNTGKDDGVAKLYLDGALAGELRGRVQTFTWDTEKTVIQVGMSYVGFVDDLAVFDRELSAAEIAGIHRLEGGIAALRK
jgi:hypothetical protein